MWRIPFPRRIVVVLVVTNITGKCCHFFTFLKNYPRSGTDMCDFSCSKMYEACGSSQGRHHHSKHKEKGGGSEPDFSGDISSFQLRLNFLTVILLHQDVLVSSDETVLPTSSMVEEMKKISRLFFSKYITLSTSSGRNDFNSGRQILQKALPDRNHLRYDYPL